MKIFASTPEEVQRLHKGLRYFQYGAGAFLILMGLTRGNYVGAGLVFALMLVMVALDNNLIPARFRGPSSPAGNTLAVALAVVLLIVIALVGWATAHGV